MVESQSKSVRVFLSRRQFEALRFLKLVGTEYGRSCRAGYRFAIRHGGDFSAAQTVEEFIRINRIEILEDE